MPRVLAPQGMMGDVGTAGLAQGGGGPLRTPFIFLAQHCLHPLLSPPPSHLFQLLTAMGPRTPRSDSHVLVSAQSRLPNLRTAYPTASSWWHECTQGASQRCWHRDAGRRKASAGTRFWACLRPSTCTPQPPEPSLRPGPSTEPGTQQAQRLFMEPKQRAGSGRPFSHCISCSPLC